jgi:hypothetical protein
MHINRETSTLPLINESAESPDSGILQGAKGWIRSCTRRRAHGSHGDYRML